MKTIKKVNISPYFVEFIPNELDEKIVYISEIYNVAVHKCLCGCGNKVVMPINHNHIYSGWNLIKSKDKVSFTPSIGNYNFDCKSHYIITNNIANFV